jgi:SNF2 family DNA or RNA helicase
MSLNLSQIKNSVDVAKERISQWMHDFGIQSRSYQQEAIDWGLYKEHCVYDQGGTFVKTTPRGLIADEMGLGKTIVMLSICVGNPVGNTLIVVPSALLNQWKSLIKKWLGHDVLVFHGRNTKLTIGEIQERPMVLTTYGMMSTRNKKSSWKSPLWSIEWDRVIYDEAHHLRNQKSNKHLGALKIQALNQWYMTGTPIQNSDKDMVSLCKLMGIWEQIKANPTSATDILIPYVKLRTKVGVGIELEPAKISTVFVEEYESVEEKNLISSVHSCLSFSEITQENADDFIRYIEGDSILPMLIRARQSCIIPHMVTNYAKSLQNEGSIPNDVNIKKIHSHTKINMIVEKIKNEKKEYRRCILFCFYIEEMNHLNAVLTNKYGMDVKMLNGRTKHSDRKIIPTLSPDVLIVQIQSCCEGLNLQQFSTVIFTSPHWNPAVEDQAIARAHRIGQTQEVRVFKYITAGLGKGTKSLDMRCAEVQEIKRKKMRDFGERHEIVSGEMPE